MTKGAFVRTASRFLSFLFFLHFAGNNNSRVWIWPQRTIAELVLIFGIFGRALYPDPNPEIGTTRGCREMAKSGPPLADGAAFFSLEKMVIIH